ncbi:azobenzene reductase [Halobacillus dabanensis]|uniref:Azobenzene reductase n=1 Tax=Halobacillus dabanensis TaxID=240302 RepID=A0A1I3TE53_HALDA|nr:NADPH-dependent FMN reductase [Halobacillus dabanensis]SFJ68900.1 azobenzene reductase [Halobacillus dabanensis]
MSIVIFSGTPRKHGRTRQVAKEVAEKLDGTLVDLSEGSLPMFNGEDAQGQNETVQWLRKIVEEAEAFVWVSPEYHNGMSGALKNALDYLGSNHFKGKPTLLLAVSGGGKGGINALNQMRTIGRGLYADVAAQQMIFDPDDFIGDGRLSRESEEKLQEVLSGFFPVQV